MQSRQRVGEGKGLVGERDIDKQHFMDTILVSKDIDENHPKRIPKVVSLFETLIYCSIKTMHSIPTEMWLMRKRTIKKCFRIFNHPSTVSGTLIRTRKSHRSIPMSNHSSMLYFISGSFEMWWEAMEGQVVDTGETSSQGWIKVVITHPVYLSQT